MFKAVCTWGEGEDVLVSSDETSSIMLHERPKGLQSYVNGYVNKASFFLKRDEAEALAQELLKAVAQCNQLEQQANDYFDKNKEPDELFSCSQCMKA